MREYRTLPPVAKWYLKELLQDCKVGDLLNNREVESPALKYNQSIQWFLTRAKQTGFLRRYNDVFWIVTKELPREQETAGAKIVCTRGIKKIKRNFKAEINREVKQYE